MRRLLLLLPVLAAACGGADPGGPLPAPPALDTSTMEPLVAETLSAARAAVVDEPANGRRWSDLGLALDAHFFLEEAEACLAVAIELDPTLFDATYDHAVLGTMLEREVDEVVARFVSAAALRDDYPPVHARLGDFLLVSGDAASSLAAFERAREVSAGLDYEYDYAQLGIGRALLDQGQVAPAVERLAPLHARFPGDPAVATALHTPQPNCNESHDVWRNNERTWCRTCGITAFWGPFVVPPPSFRKERRGWPRSCLLTSCA